MERRDFVRLAGTAALTPGLATTIDWDRFGGVRHSPLWPGYGDAIVVDALAGPIQFNIPQEGLPLSNAALNAVRGSGITAVNITVNARPTENQSALEATAAKMEALRTVGVPYTDADIAGAKAAVEGKKEIDALIAYLQGLGTFLKVKR